MAENDRGHPSTSANDEARRQRYQASEWQIRVIEVVFQPSLMGLLTQPRRPMDMIEEAPG